MAKSSVVERSGVVATVLALVGTGFVAANRMMPTWARAAAGLGAAAISASILRKALADDKPKGAT